MVLNLSFKLALYASSTNFFHYRNKCCLCNLIYVYVRTSLKSSPSLWHVLLNMCLWRTSFTIPLANISKASVTYDVSLSPFLKVSRTRIKDIDYSVVLGRLPSWVAPSLAHRIGGKLNMSRTKVRDWKTIICHPTANHWHWQLAIL